MYFLKLKYTLLKIIILTCGRLSTRKSAVAFCRCINQAKREIKLANLLRMEYNKSVLKKIWGKILVFHSTFIAQFESLF